VGWFQAVLRGVSQALLAGAFVLYARDVLLGWERVVLPALAAYGLLELARLSRTAGEDIGQALGYGAGVMLLLELRAFPLAWGWALALGLVVVARVGRRFRGPGAPMPAPPRRGR